MHWNRGGGNDIWKKKKLMQGALISTLPVWVAGVQSCLKPLRNCIENASDTQPEGRGSWGLCAPMLFPHRLRTTIGRGSAIVLVALPACPDHGVNKLRMSTGRNHRWLQ